MQGRSPSRHQLNPEARFKDKSQKPSERGAQGVYVEPSGRGQPAATTGGGKAQGRAAAVCLKITIKKRSEERGGI